MATAIGRIESIEGSAEVLHADGSISVLLQGTTVYANDVITTDGSSNLGIKFLDGSGMNIDPESSVTLNKDTVNPELIPEDEGSSQVVLDASGRMITPASGHDTAGIGEKIGSVETLAGNVEAIGEDGTVRVLKSGDPLYATDVIRVDSNGNVSIRMVDGSHLSFGPGTTARMGDNAPSLPTYVADSGLTDPVQIQTAIQEGRDPSQEATAPEAGEKEGNEGGLPVILPPSPRAVTPDSGHDTHGFELPFRIPESETVAFDEDVLPVAVVRLRGELVSIDESAGRDDDSNDVDPIVDPIPPFLPTEFGGVSAITAAVRVIAAADESPFEWARTEPGAVSAEGSTPGSIVLSLTDSDGNPFDGDDSGLDVTSGNSIFLYTYAESIVVGREGTDSGQPDPGGAPAIIFAVDADGTVWMFQFKAVVNHVPGDGTSPPKSHDETTPMNLIHATVTVTDGNGNSDSATSESPIKLGFQDDGPVAALEPVEGAKLVLDETEGTKAGDTNANDEAHATRMRRRTRLAMRSWRRRVCSRTVRCMDRIKRWMRTMMDRRTR